MNGEYEKNLAYSQRFIEGFYKKKQLDENIRFVNIKFSLCSDQLTKMVIFSVQDSKHKTNETQAFVVSLTQNSNDFLYQMKACYQTFCLKSKNWHLASSTTKDNGYSVD